MPSGSINIGDQTRISPINSVVGAINDLLELPIRTGAGPPVSIRDVGSVSDSTDIPTAYALVNGRRAVYIPVTKRPNASTLSVVAEVRANLGRFQALVPDDITVSYELDQSTDVSAALQSVLREAVLGALLTGLMVLVFLGDWRSSAIVVVTIPFALLAATVALWGAGQTINIMTLGGLALAVGILVDEATVAIENIHTHLDEGRSVPRAVLDSSREIVLPKLLSLLCILAVFVPAFLMEGVPRALFVPLTLAAFGIVLRGSGFAFRKAVFRTRDRRNFGAAFAISSVIVPYCMGTVAGAIASGRVPAGGAAPWASAPGRRRRAARLPCSTAARRSPARHSDAVPPAWISRRPRLRAVSKPAASR
jgi:multidrug efflux pump subunit AcrB